MSLFRFARFAGLFAALLLLDSSSTARQEKPEPKQEVPAAKKPNRLAKESSPYLLQHAHNPVDWYAWGPEAFERAKKEKKLIFLSIGYSSCHWCHVMERESFSNPAIARTLNEHFVCIKVDREERPDIDDIYMTALNVTGMQGGWPLTMILTPEGKPIFGGTYFPPEDKKVGEDTMPGLKSVLARVIELDRTERADLLKQADKIAEMTVDALERNARTIALIKLSRDLVNNAVEAFEIDPVHGGTGNKSRDFKGTKFPRPPVWSFLVSQSKKPGREELAKLVKLTLERMAEGGIHDHLGGGFHRYSTERTWTVPHFEKMLYDNAQLVELYSEAYRLSPSPLYKRVAERSLAFIDREMTSPEGLFYSALDADSNHKEGEFYVWTAEELDRVLAGEAEAPLFRRVYGVAAPNFEEKFFILRLPKSLAEIAREQKTTEAEILARLAPLEKKLLALRAKRERPFLDTKAICAWNGQMIAALARAGQVFGEKSYTQRAEKAADFILKNMRGKDGRLARLWAGAPGEKPTARGAAFLDDYAYLIHGLLNLYDATGDRRWLTEAASLTDVAIRWYGDPDRGGFFFTASDGEKLFARAKDSYDGVQPSGNSQMARNLLRLWQRTRTERYRELCTKSVKLFALPLRMQPGSLVALAQCLDELLDATEPDTGTAETVPAPKNPRESADVVKAVLKLGEPAATGERPFSITLTIAPGWHIYANPIGNDMLTEARTELVISTGKETIPASVAYPKGQEIMDSTGSKYAIYQGTVAITGTLPAGKAEPVFRIKLTACQEGKCLLRSVITPK
jgi:uncharacterized protein YyaL (SSP411 family)